MTHNIAVLIRSAFLSLVCGLAVFQPAQAQAQEASTQTVTLPDPLTPATIDTLVSRLSDSEVRDLLLQELGVRAATDNVVKNRQTTLTDSFVTSFRLMLLRLASTVMASSENLTAIFAAIGQYTSLLGPAESLRLILSLIAAALAGIATDWLFSRQIAGKTGRPVMPEPAAPVFPGSIPFLTRRLGKDAGGAVLALIVGAVVLVVALPERETRVAMHIAIQVLFFPRIASIVLSFFLSPARPELRLVTADDRTAGILVYNLVGMTFVVGLVQTALLIMQEANAVGHAASVGLWVDLLVFMWLAVTVVRCSEGLKQIVRGGQVAQTPDDTWIVAAYPAFALTSIVVIWLASIFSRAIGDVEFMGDGRYFASLSLLLVAPMCDSLIRATVRLILPPMRGTGAGAQQAFEDAWHGLIRIARLVVFGSIILVLASLWGISLVDIAQAGVGVRLGERIVVTMMVLIVGYVLQEVVRLLFNFRLANEQSDVMPADPSEMDENGSVAAGGSTRLGTILPPLSRTLQGAIIVVTVLTALGQLGINVAALLAGAGVAGIAVGFGAQKLVADVVSGVFFLLDDAFRINEYVAADSLEGTVEKIALQSMHLRQSDGALICLPYSNIGSVTNFSRDWGVMKLVFTVPFDTNIEVVRKIFKQIGQDLAKNPEYQDLFLQPFKFKGVSEVNDVGIVVRGKFMFKPEFGKQFMIRREIYKRVQADFAQAGIQFARREVRVSVNPTAEPVSEATTSAIAGAAAETSQRLQPQP